MTLNLRETHKKQIAYAKDAENNNNFKTVEKILKTS